MATIEPELSRRERKKEETRERLLTAAWDLYRHKGFEATTVAEITDAADVAKGTFFNYFASKEEMLLPLASWRMNKLADQLDVARGAPASPLARIRLLLRGLAQDIFPNPELARRTLSSMLCRPPESNRPPFLLRRSLISLVQEAQAQGELRDDVDARLMARLLLISSWHDTLRAAHAAPSPATDAAHRAPADPSLEVDHIMDILLTGLAGAKERVGEIESTR